MIRMKILHIPLRNEIFEELVDAAARCAKADEPRCTPEEFAKECIESELASAAPGTDGDAVKPGCERGDNTKFCRLF